MYQLEITKWVPMTDEQKQERSNQRNYDGGYSSGPTFQPADSYPEKHLSVMLTDSE
jgi:hypothetical protein